MKTIILLFSFILSGAQLSPSDFFKEDYIFAQRYLHKHRNDFGEIISSFNLTSAIVFPIVFPELVRYSMWKDYLETTTLELLYIDDPSKSGYFSIGQFQIKPVFVEKLEKYILENKNAYSDIAYIAAYKNVEPHEMRRERLNRLKMASWQIKYVCAMIKIVNNRYDLSNTSEIELIKVYCSAYNHDFLCSYDENILWQDKKLFPYGMKKDNPYSYVEVALHYYQQSKNNK